MKIQDGTGGRSALEPWRTLASSHAALSAARLVSVALGINLLQTGPSLAAEPPINLGRTSLASVDASSVNGNRPLNCPYYGILNAFDDGWNMFNGLNYTTWSTDPGEPASAEVHFAQPVQVTSVLVVQGLPFKATFSLSNGDEGQAVSEQLPPPTPTEVPFIDNSLRKPDISLSYRAELRPPLRDVVKVRLDFANADHERYRSAPSHKVAEIRIMGYVPPGLAYTVCQPKILMTDKNVLLVAQGAFEEWRESLRDQTTVVRSEDEDNVVFTFSKEGVALIRVFVNKRDGTASVVDLLTSSTESLRHDTARAQSQTAQSVPELVGDPVEAIRAILPSHYWIIEDVVEHTQPRCRLGGEGTAVYLTYPLQKNRKPGYDAAVYLMPTDYDDGGDAPIECDTHPARRLLMTDTTKVYLWSSYSEGWANIERDIRGALVRVQTTGNPQKPYDDTITEAEALDMAEATFRYQFEHTLFGRRVPENWECFLSLFRMNPKQPFLDRFQGSPFSVKKGSDFVQGKAIYFTMCDIRRISPTKVEVGAAQWAGDLGAMGCTYIIELRKGKWVVTSETIGVQS